MTALQLLLCALILTVAVHGFHLGDHSSITTQAMKEYWTCFPKTRLNAMLSDIIKGNRNEDINLWNKWVKGYAHFYNPYRQVKVCSLGFCRSSTDVRLRMLESSLVNKTGDWAKTVGAIVHHLQDMNSPPHVVPVMHAQSDGFESYSNKAFPAFNPDCANFTQLYASIASQTNSFLFAMLNRTAIATLRTLSATTPYIQGGNLTKGTWSTLFWQNAKVDSNNFGTYGSLGNNYGHTTVPFPVYLICECTDPVQFSANGKAIAVSVDVYENYKRGQLRSAVDATKLVFLYADKLNP